MSFVSITRNEAPLILSIPHAGIDLPDEIAAGVVSPWLARKDADWWLPLVYGFAARLGATIVSTSISRTVIDVNRDPSGVSLYPGQATTGLCPLTTFDGEPLYREGCAPDEAEMARRREVYFAPYHAAVAGEIARLRAQHQRVVLYDCHSIRSVIPRLFAGELPNFNIGTNDGKACAPEITERVAAICAAGETFTSVVNGRFKGGWITRHYGNPANGVNAIQMELACRGYILEPDVPTLENWPPPYDEDYAAPMLTKLHSIIESLLP